MIKVLFISYPVGFGHATRDIKIANILSACRPDLAITFVSSGKAESIFRNNGYNTVNTLLPESGSYVERLECFLRLINSLRPQIILTDEEPLILPLARAMGIPAIIFTDYLPKDKEEIQFFSSAERIIIPDVIGNWQLIEDIKKKTVFVGPILNTCPVKRVKKDLTQIVVLVVGGGRLKDGKDICAHSILAFKNLKFPVKRLIIAGVDRAQELREILNSNCIEVLGYLPSLDKYYATSDVVITRGGHTTLWELVHYRVPSVSIPFNKNINPCNIAFVQSMEKRGTTKMISEDNLTPQLLKNTMESVLFDEKMKNNLNKISNDIKRKETQNKHLLIDTICQYIPS